MELQSIFYGIGIFFLFVTIGFISFTYLEDVTSEIKAILLLLLAVILFVIGDYLRRIDY